MRETEVKLTADMAMAVAAALEGMELADKQLQGHGYHLRGDIELWCDDDWRLGRITYEDDAWGFISDYADSFRDA